ncbi:MAG: hypothetical protein JXB49_16310 [Bacteroidales bacterium]|nr:hypothetical protein [Bacteroidales bacterium]
MGQITKIEQVWNDNNPSWFFIPEHQNLPGGFDFYEGMKEAINSGKAEIVTTEEYGMKPGPVNVSDDSKYHLDTCYVSE